MLTLPQLDRPSHTRLHDLLSRMAGRRVLVLGDMVADEYILGRPVRLSREAPIPVLEYVDRYILPGGATNVARNARAMGGEVAVAGVVGRDEPGGALRARLVADGIAVEGLIEDAGRPTSTKTRVIGGSAQVVSQQLARIDRVVHTEIGPDDKARLVAYLQRALTEVDALIVSDYENGVINADIIAAALPLAEQRGLTIAVDAHGALWRFRGITVATPNQEEAAAELGRVLQSDDDVMQAGRELVALMGAQGVLMTRGSEGMTIVAAGGLCQHLPAAVHSEVRDATGAGDTVAAVATLALAAGGSLLEAADLANRAAGIVVRRLGAATATAAELAAQLAASQAPYDTPFRPLERAAPPPDTMGMT